MYKLGLNGATIPSANLEEGLRAAASAGFEAYEPRYPALLRVLSEGEILTVNQLRRKLGLAWFPLNALEINFASAGGAMLRKAIPMFRDAARAGIRAIIVCPARSLDPNKVDTGRAVGCLRALVKEARQYDVGLYFELLGFSDRPFHRLEEVVVLARESGVRLALDTFHLTVSGVDPEEIATLPDDAIGIVHLSDALSEGRVLSELQDEERVLPGEGGLSLVPLLTAVRETGYQGPISIEVFHPKYGERDPYEVAREAFERAQNVLRRAGWL